MNVLLYTLSSTTSLFLTLSMRICDGCYTIFPILDLSSHGTSKKCIVKLQEQLDK